MKKWLPVLFAVVLAFAAGWFSSAAFGSHQVANTGLIQFVERSSFVAKCLECQRTGNYDQLNSLLEMSLNHSAGGIERMVDLGATLNGDTSQRVLDGLLDAAAEAEKLGRPDDAEKFRAAYSRLGGT